MRRPAASPPVLVVLLLSLVLGCSGEGSDARAGEQPRSAGPTARASTGPSEAAEVYFAQADSDAVNDVVARAQRSGQQTMAARRQARCNSAGDQGYAAWRACWHRLLDPFARDLGAIGARLATLAERDLPARCSRTLRAGDERFTGFQERVEGLLAGIDDEARAAQERAMGRYDRVIRGIGEGFAPYFQQLTRACYSPSDLASIDAAARASASPSTSTGG